LFFYLIISGKNSTIIPEEVKAAKIKMVRFSLTII
jgi:hypothetical protein